MSESIMQDRKECYITHSTERLHKHHLMRGSHRKAAEKYGCWVWLRNDWHTDASYSIHNNPRLEMQLRQICQMNFEKIYGHEKWMQVFGKNYI